MLFHTLSTQTGLAKVSLPHTLNASPSPALIKPFEVLCFSLKKLEIGWEPSSLMAAALREMGDLCVCLAETALPAATALHVCAGLRVRVAEPSGWHLLLEQLSLNSPGKREQARWKHFPG